MYYEIQIGSGTQMGRKSGNAYSDPGSVITYSTVDDPIICIYSMLTRKELTNAQITFSLEALYRDVRLYFYIFTANQQ